MLIGFTVVRGRSLFTAIAASSFASAASAEVAVGCTRASDLGAPRTHDDNPAEPALNTH